MHTDLEQQQAVARQLRALPAQTPPPYDWEEFQRRARARSSFADVKRKHAAVAAALVILVAAIAGWSRLMKPHGAPESAARTEHLADGPAGAPDIGVAATTQADAMDVRADAVERWLATLPKEPVVVRVGTRAAVAGLEDHIAQLDDLLTAGRVEGTQTESLLALQQQRARLVSSLAQVRYAETLAAQSR